MKHLYAVILAGGAGTRFWPASRQNMPKQLLALGENTHESLLAATVRRILPLCPLAQIYIATNQHLVAKTQAALPGIPHTNFLSEPVPRNTAPCIGWATHTIARRDPNATLLVLPADHTIQNEEVFRTTLEEAIQMAQTGAITTIGLNPNRPETGYGYIEIGEPLGGQTFRVARFIEKPDLSRAECFLASGHHVWNGGMFVFRAEVLKTALSHHLPTLAKGLNELDLAATQGQEQVALTRLFPIFPSISIDHGIMEKSDNLAVIRGDFGWSDVGSWQSAWELAIKDAHGNAAPAQTVLIDAHHNLIQDLRSAGQPRTVALVGVDDLVVIQTDDALLVIPRSRAQDVRLAVEALKRRGDTQLVLF